MATIDPILVMPGRRPFPNSRSPQLEGPSSSLTDARPAAADGAPAGGDAELGADVSFEDCSDDEAPLPITDPDAICIGDDNLYSVRCIMGYNPKKRKYLVAWVENDPATGYEWEPEWLSKECLTPDLLENWKKEIKKNPKLNLLPHAQKQLKEWTKVRDAEMSKREAEKKAKATRPKSKSVSVVPAGSAAQGQAAAAQVEKGGKRKREDEGADKDKAEGSKKKSRKSTSTRKFLFTCRVPPYLKSLSAP